MQRIYLNQSSKQTLRRQIYLDIKNQILSGALKEKESLPSTRALSADLNVARSTVCEAYEMLIAEGYLLSRQGAPTQVASGIAMEPIDRSAPINIAIRKDVPYLVDFRTGRPDLRQFPTQLWKQMLNRGLDKTADQYFGYSDPQGIPALRTEIAAWLRRSRGLNADEADIFITQGATHALHILSGLLQGTILTEDPCHTGMLRTFQNRGCTVIPIPTDEYGICTQELHPYQAGAVYVTPSHQFPMGGILPATRRAELVHYAVEKGSYVIEDDYDSEFRYCGDPIMPLYARAPQQVIYVGTFSKSLYPALRIGYVILPEALQKCWLRMRTYTDVQNPMLEQAALTEFLASGKLERHVQRMRRLYRERRRVLWESLRQNFEMEWSACGDDAGLHLTVDFPALIFDDDFRKSCLTQGINLSSVEYHCIEKGKHKSKLLIGYGHLEPDEIRAGIQVLRSHMGDYFGF